MASLQDIRRRIKSVKSIQQITKAMKMVAAARLRRAQQAAIANKPYAEKMAEIVENAAGGVKDFKHPLLAAHNGPKKLYLVIASDKGLAGAYASNVFKEVTPQIPDKEAVDLVAIGRKTVDYFNSRGYNIVNKYLGISERPTFDWAKTIADDIVARYDTGEYSAVYITFTRFVSAISSIPETVQLLPFEGIVVSGEEAVNRLQKLIEAKAQLAYFFKTKYAALKQRVAAKKAVEGEAAETDEAELSAEIGTEEAKEIDLADAIDKALEEAGVKKDDETAAVPEENSETEKADGEEKPEDEGEPQEEPEEENSEEQEEAPYVEEAAEEKDPYIFEPSADAVLGFLLPQYLITMIYGAQLQAAASELSSRMTAMSNATDNAEELIKKLDLHYNKVRQASITREISEIVGGAEALK